MGAAGTHAGVYIGGVASAQVHGILFVTGRPGESRHQFHLFAYARLDGLCRGACRCGCQQYTAQQECLHRLHLSYEFVGSGTHGPYPV